MRLHAAYGMPFKYINIFGLARGEKRVTLPVFALGKYPPVREKPSRLRENRVKPDLDGFSPNVSSRD